MNYRILKQGEQILPDDEYLDEKHGEWTPRQWVGAKEFLNLASENGIHTPHRRKVEYPEHTPPAPPEGMKWEYRGMGWANNGESCDYYTVSPESLVSPMWKYAQPGENMSYHYFEAVPDVNPAKLYEKLDQVLTDLAENPKESAGRKKCPMHLLSPSAMRETANALGHGAAKYSARNYRTAGVNATTYVAAVLRHITAWNDGEDLDPESGLSHIAHVAACADILLDTMACGKMNDDRSKRP